MKIQKWIGVYFKIYASDVQYIEEEEEEEKREKVCEPSRKGFAEPQCGKVGVDLCFKKLLACAK